MVRLTGETVTGEWVTDTGATITGRHVTVKGLAQMLDVTTDAVHYHLRQGHIHHHRVGHAILIPATDARRIASGYVRNKSWPTTPKDSPRDRSSRAHE